MVAKTNQFLLEEADKPLQDVAPLKQELQQTWRKYPGSLGHYGRGLRTKSGQVLVRQAKDIPQRLSYQEVTSLATKRVVSHR